MTSGRESEAAGNTAGNRVAVAEWIQWQLEAGVDCTLEAAPVAASQPRSASGPLASRWPATAAAVVASRTHAAGLEHRTEKGTRASAAVADARALARSCQSIDELREALLHFRGCALVETATQLCFADGAPDAPLFIVGEAPGAEEDRIGRPFVGQSGQLLDRMLAWIGRDRTNTWITNAIFWRPPGNRTPTPAEIAICQPFLERQIELLKPRLLLFLGGIAARALLGVSEGVSRLRGRTFLYTNEMLPAPIPALVTFHPAYLLRQPAHKRLVWRDFLSAAEMLEKAAGAAQE